MLPPDLRFFFFVSGVCDGVGCGVDAPARGAGEYEGMGRVYAREGSGAYCGSSGARGVGRGAGGLVRPWFARMRSLSALSSSTCLMSCLFRCSSMEFSLSRFSALFLNSLSSSRSSRSHAAMKRHAAATSRQSTTRPRSGVMEALVLIGSFPVPI